MSHFVGIIFGEIKDEILDRYCENVEVDQYIDKSPEEVKKYVRERVESMKQYIEIHQYEDDKYTQNRVIDLRNFLSRYNNFESDEDYQRYAEHIFTLDDQGNSLSTYNPESKWDWYEIGGRWNGEILHAGEYDTNQATKDDLTKIDTPLCFIDLDGEWHEQGSVGWWGCISDEKEDSLWEKEFRDYLNSVPGDTLLTVIDFHI